MERQGHVEIGTVLIERCSQIATGADSFSKLTFRTKVRCTRLRYAAPARPTRARRALPSRATFLSSARRRKADVLESAISGQILSSCSRSDRLIFFCLSPIFAKSRPCKIGRDNGPESQKNTTTFKDFVNIFHTFLKYVKYP